MLITIGGTCRQWETGILAKPTAAAPAAEAMTIPPPTSGNMMLNFKNPAIEPHKNMANKALGGVLNKMENPMAAQPHQKALKMISIQSDIITL
jgi:hypothetical protein